MAHPVKARPERVERFVLLVRDTYSAKGDGNDIADGSQGNGDDGGNLHFDCCGGLRIWIDLESEDEIEVVGDASFEKDHERAG